MLKFISSNIGMLPMLEWLTGFVVYVTFALFSFPVRAENSDTCRRLLSDYVRSFNATDEELYTNAIPNVTAEAFLAENAPLFTCPNKDIERTYYFRWWTFRKHLKRIGQVEGRNGGKSVWRVTEFLPKVGWSGKDNTIVCPAGHHLLEGRWLRDPQFIEDNARFWLSDSEATHRWAYSSWLFTGTRLVAEVTGHDGLPDDLLDDAVKYYERWEQGFARDGWPMGGDGRGGFLSIDNYEGTELSLGGNGYKPLFASAMWSEAKAISEVAAQIGRMELAARYAAKAEANRQSIFQNCWNSEIGFFTTCPTNGPKGGRARASWLCAVVFRHADRWTKAGLVATIGSAGVCCAKRSVVSRTASEGLHDRL